MKYPLVQTPVAPAVTPRILSLLTEAKALLAQARYEGSHVQRQEPAPYAHGPWSTPDLPQPVLFALMDAQSALAKALATAVAHTDALAPVNA